MTPGAWPSLPYAEWKDTKRALHMWTQIVGKIRLGLTPLMNHWWNSTLFVTPRGLTTGIIPSGDDAFEIGIDLRAHRLVITTSHRRAEMPLGAMSVAGFYAQLISELERAGIPDPRINVIPSEVASAIPFPEDGDVRPYDREMVERFHTIILRTHRVFDAFRAGFFGKASPVHFFWGGFDLASARFSGRRGPAYQGGNPPNTHIHVMHESYSHELIAAGFWPGSDETPQAEFYAYAMPPPDGIAEATIRPDSAGWVAARGEFLLPYESVRVAGDPAKAIRAFLESTYDAAADLAGWDRSLLEERVSCDCAPIPMSARRTAR